jgi:hypothetical protein
MTRHRIAEIHDGAIIRLIYDGFSQSQAKHDYEHARYMDIPFPRRLEWTKNGKPYKVYQADKIP